MAAYRTGDKLLHFGLSDRYYTKGKIYMVSCVVGKSINVIDETGNNHILTDNFAQKCFKIIVDESDILVKSKTP